ncbi:MAG: hypothetical protein GX442_02320 [Candidatus Riflebacteria bacterium]|nr:hypothetical protein [Candidatus Riflebacteria bacterium]
MTTDLPGGTPVPRSPPPIADPFRRWRRAWVFVCLLAGLLWPGGGWATGAPAAGAATTVRPAPGFTQPPDGPQGTWSVASAPVAGGEIRLPRSMAFRPLQAGDSLPDDFLIRYRPDGVASQASPAGLAGRGGALGLDIHRGAVVRWRHPFLSPLLGRFGVTVATGTSPLAVRVPQALLEIQAGEAMMEVDGNGNASVALRKGVAWVKTPGRQIIRLVPGRQIDLPRWGDPGSLRDQDARWSEVSRGFLTSAVARPLPPPPADDDEEERQKKKDGDEDEAREGTARDEIADDTEAAAARPDRDSDVGPGESGTSAMDDAASLPAVLDLDRPVTYAAPTASGVTIAPDAEREWETGSGAEDLVPPVAVGAQPSSPAAAISHPASASASAAPPPETPVLPANASAPRSP